MSSYINWSDESDSHLLYDYKMDEKLIESFGNRARNLVANQEDIKLVQNKVLNDSEKRIIRVDVDRIFVSAMGKSRLTVLLTKLYQHYTDYHQSLGQVCGFLSVITDEKTIIKIVDKINHHFPTLFWTSSPIVVSTCAYVIHNHIFKFYPELDTILNENMQVRPETYIQRWTMTCGMRLFDDLEYVMQFIEKLYKNKNVIYSYILGVYQQLLPHLRTADTIYTLIDLKTVDFHKLFNNLVDVSELVLRGFYTLSYNTTVLPMIQRAEENDSDYSDIELPSSSDEEEEEDVSRLEKNMSSLSVEN
jgi:hypothetical protein